MFAHEAIEVPRLHVEDSKSRKRVSFDHVHFADVAYGNLEAVQCLYPAKPLSRKDATIRTSTAGVRGSSQRHLFTILIRYRERPRCATSGSLLIMAEIPSFGAIARTTSHHASKLASRPSARPRSMDVT